MNKSPRRGQMLRVNSVSKNNSIEDNVININVGGRLFQTYKSTLQRKQGTRLSRIGFADEAYRWNKNEYFFDRHSGAFESVLEYLRSGQLHIPKTMCSRLFSKELSFWGIDKRDISDCCWHTYCQGMEEENTYKRLKRNIFDTDPFNIVSRKPREKLTTSEKVWLFLEYPEFSRFARIWGYLNMLILILSTLTHALFTLEELRIPDNAFQNSPFHNITNRKVKMMVVTNPRPEILYTEISFLSFITVDFVIRFVTCPRKFWFIKTISFWVDILYMIPGWIVIVPYYWFPWFWKHEGRVSHMMTLHTLMVVRIFRLFGLTRYYHDLHTMFFAIRASVKEMFLLFAFILIAMILYGSMVFTAELYTEDSFHNSFSGFWWALITMSTVGYGDMYPVSVPGYIVGSMCTLTGLIFVGLPIAIITNKFNAYYSYRQRNHIVFSPSSPAVAPTNGI